MPQQRGSKSKIVYDSETVFKTLPAPTDGWVLPFVSETLKLNRNLVESKVIRNTRNASAPARGNREVSGDINLELNTTMGRIFWNALGTCASVGTISTCYTHTFKVADLPPGMIFEKQFLDLTTPKYFRYSGCRVNGLKFTIKPEGMIEMNLSLIGAAETITTSTFEASPVDNGHQPFDGYTATIKKDTVSLGTITEIDINLDNNLDGSVYVLDGTGERYSIPDGLVKISGTLKALFNDDTLYQTALNNTECKIQVFLVRGTGSGTTGNETMTITIPEVILQPSAPVISGPTGLLVELPFIAYYDNDASATSFMIEMRSPVEKFVL